MFNRMKAKMWGQKLQTHQYPLEFTGPMEEMEQCLVGMEKLGKAAQAWARRAGSGRSDTKTEALSAAYATLGSEVRGNPGAVKTVNATAAYTKSLGALERKQEQSTQAFVDSLSEYVNGPGKEYHAKRKAMKAKGSDLESAAGKARKNPDQEELEARERRLSDEHDAAVEAVKAVLAAAKTDRTKVHAPALLRFATAHRDSLSAAIAAVDKAIKESA